MTVSRKGAESSRSAIGHGYHGIPSGIDNTASTYGGLLMFRISDGSTSFARISVEQPFRVVLANSGVTADTTTLDGFVLAIRDRDPDAFEQRLETIREQAGAMKAALEGGDLDTVGRIMTANHQILVEMGLSHEKLVYLCHRVLALGALGAKLTGGGRGGYMLALTPGEDLQAAVARSLEEEGLEVIRATIGGG